MSKIVNIFGFSDESGKVNFNLPNCFENANHIALLELFIKFDKLAANITGKITCNWLAVTDEN